MAWLFGGLEMDLTAAERAVDELARDRDAEQDQVTRLQELAQQQKRRIEDMQRILAAANLMEEEAHQKLEGSRRTAQQKRGDLALVKQQLAKASAIFAL
ncbi:MAG: hypothetical protein ACPIOQ_54975, partial [Promethearchaeia archaeon]